VEQAWSRNSRAPAPPEEQRLPADVYGGGLQALRDGPAPDVLVSNHSIRIGDGDLTELIAGLAENRCSHGCQNPGNRTMTPDFSELLLEEKGFGTIFADPPWPERGAGRIKRGADRHYPLMQTADIASLGSIVQQLAKPDSHLYLWITNNFMPAGLEVMKSWGFRHITTITWMKAGKIGVGQYYRGVTEHVLFGVRGKPGYRTSRTGKRAQARTGFMAPRGRHSQKPDQAYVWARQVSYGPYLELFAIGERPGWTVWGNGVWRKESSALSCAPGPHARGVVRDARTSSTAHWPPSCPASTSCSSARLVAGTLGATGCDQGFTARPGRKPKRKCRDEISPTDESMCSGASRNVPRTHRRPR
jgi:N6-adenosine-specific RNA methylase IME4